MVDTLKWLDEEEKRCFPVLRILNNKIITSHDIPQLR